MGGVSPHKHAAAIRLATIDSDHEAEGTRPASIRPAPATACHYFGNLRLTDEVISRQICAAELTT
jgi:hypothetical protein